VKKYNIILLMTDQHRFDCLGCAGNPAIETPNLDFLASQGTLFSHAYTPCPSCIPARACLMSGMNPWNTGVLGMGRGQGEMGGGFSQTLPGELTKAGYYTKGVGKMHFGPQRLLNGFHSIELDESARVQAPGFASDYKEWFDRNKTGDYTFMDHGVAFNSWVARPWHAPEFLHPSNWVINQSIAFLKKRDPSMPYFLKASFARPHSPYDAPPYYFEHYEKKELPKAWYGDWDRIHDVPQDAADVNAWQGRRTDEEIAQARAGYYGSVTHIDHQIGRLINFLQRSGQYEDTIILFTSDHGDMLGDHNLWRKTYAYEGSAHIPFLIRLPKELRENAPRICDVPVTLYDILPTVLGLVGLPIPEAVDGLDLSGLMRGETECSRKYLHGEHCTCYAERQETQYLTDGLWKYIWLPRVGEEQLFNLKNDPCENNDLASDAAYADELALWRGRMVEILSKRDCGLTDGDHLVCQAGCGPIISPHYQERLQNWGFDSEDWKQSMRLVY